MAFECLHPLRHECFRLIGMVLGTIRLHQVDFLSVGNVDVVQKQRRIFACLAIPIGNVFQVLTRSPHFALSTRRWLAWERAIENSARQRLLLTESCDVLRQRFVLTCRRVPGSPLSQILADGSYSLVSKLDAFRIALKALLRLHAVSADWGRGVQQSISHGDATASNVVVDLNHGSACWIDFETRHDPRLAKADREADDLRSLVYSAAVFLPVSSFSNLAHVLLHADIHSAILQRFEQRLTTEWILLTPFHLAQAPLKWPAAMALRAALLETLSRHRS